MIISDRVWFWVCKRSMCRIFSIVLVFYCG